MNDWFQVAELALAHRYAITEHPEVDIEAGPTFLNKKRRACLELNGLAFP